MNSEKIEKLVTGVRKSMGTHLVGVVDRHREDGQLAFCTDEPDPGESVRGKWLDCVEKAVEEAGLRHAPCMPFPVQGKLIYVVAGLKRDR